MARKPQPVAPVLVNFRLEPALIARLDRYAADLSASSGIRYSRANALRAALAEVLERHDKRRAK